MAKKKNVKFDPTKERVITFSRNGEKLSEINGELKSDFYSGVEKMCYLSDEYCAFYKGKKKGILNSKGEMITPAEWLSIRKQGDVFKVSKKNKVTKYEEYGFINLSGEELFNPEEYTSVNDMHDGRIVAENLDAGKECAFDLKGNLVVAPKYIRLGNFHHNVAVACEEKGKVGIIDLSGNWVLEPVYSSIGGFGGMDGLKKYSSIGKDGKYGLINQDLKIVIEPKYDDIYDFDDTEGLIVVVGSCKKQGVVDASGNWLLPAEYDRINIYPEERYMKLEKGNKFGIADLKGNIIVKVEYLNLDYKHGLLYVKKGFDGVMIQRPDGTTIFEGKYARIFPEMVLVSSDGKQWGVIDHNGKELIVQEWNIPASYINQVKFYDGLLNLYRDDKTIYIDEKGQVRVSIDARGWAYSDGFAIIGKKDDYSVINKTGEVVAANLAHLSTLGEGYFFVNNADENEPKILNVNTDDKVAIPARVIEKPVNGMIKIQASASNYGVVEIVTGKVILEPMYEEVLLTADGIWGCLPKAK